MSAELDIEPLTKPDIDVICIGQCRTGTQSLARALEILYPGSKCYHISQIAHQDTDHLNIWCDGGTFALTSELANYLFHGYRFISGPPSFLEYEKILAMFPHAKVIITYREPESWLRSYMATYMNFRHNFTKSMVLKYPKFTWRWKYSELFHLCMVTYLKNDQNMRLYLSRDWGLSQYNEILKKQRTLVADREFLELDLGDGWEKLCRFLGKPVPEVEYPHLNKTFEFLEFMDLDLEEDEHFKCNEDGKEQSMADPFSFRFFNL